MSKGFLLALILAVLVNGQDGVEVLVPLDNSCQHSHSLVYGINITLTTEQVMGGLTSASDYLFRVDLGWDTAQLLAYVEKGRSFFLTEYGIEFPPVAEAWDALSMTSIDGNFEMIGKQLETDLFSVLVLHVAVSSAEGYLQLVHWRHLWRCLGWRPHCDGSEGCSLWWPLWSSCLYNRLRACYGWRDDSVWLLLLAHGWPWQHSTSNRLPRLGPHGDGSLRRHVRLVPD